MSFRRRFLHALDTHGPSGLLCRAFTRTRPHQTRQPEAPAQPHPFDRLHNTDTSGYIPGQFLPSGRPGADFGNTAFYAISPSTLTAALQLIPEPLAPFTFIDLGCGKGRALLVAATFPFANLLGVELSLELCRIARHNLASSNIPRCQGKVNLRITILEADASTIAYPETPLVLFLYHPFLAPILRRTLRNLLAQLQRHPRPTYLLYANPTYPHILRRFPTLQPVWEQFLPLSEEDAAADRHGITEERYILYRAT